jgi:hypothetical protein
MTKTVLGHRTLIDANGNIFHDSESQSRWEMAARFDLLESDPPQHWSGFRGYRSPAENLFIDAEYGVEPPEIVTQAAAEHYAKLDSTLAGNIEGVFLTGNYADVRRFIAESVETPVATLEALAASDPDEGVRLRLAGNEAAPETALMTLAESPDATIRYRVAKNRAATPNVLARLASDVEDSVREAVAWNDRTAPTTLDLLAREKLIGIQHGISQHYRASYAALSLLSRSEDVGTRRNTASNPNTPGSVLRDLSTDSDRFVVRRVSSNKSTPQIVLIGLSQSQDAIVRDYAKSTLDPSYAA